jgi:hypothetical protein
LEVQQSFLEKKRNPLEDLRHGLYLGTEEFSEECRERTQNEGRREKPQARLLPRDRDLPGLSQTILEPLGEQDPDSALAPRRRRCLSRDVAIYLLHHQAVYRNEEIGKIFGVGYTAITGAVKRGQTYVNSDRRVQNTVRRILNDI